MLQNIFVAVCVLLAALFMGVRFYKAFKRRGCSGDCAGDCKTRECGGGAVCPRHKNLEPIRPAGDKKAP